MGGEELRIDGVWVQSVGHVGDLSWMDRWPGGCYEATWNMALATGARPACLHKGALVEVMAGAEPVWSGELADTGWSTGAFRADGLCRPAETYTAFDASLNTTTRGDVAVDQAIARGWLALGRTGVTTATVNETTSTNQTNTVADVLDALADQQGQRWGVGADRYVFMADDPTEPMWHMAPGVVELGTGGDEYASDVYVRYILTGTGVYTTASASVDDDTRDANGTIEYLVDATPLGAITALKAGNIAASILAGGRAKPGWLDGVEVTSAQVTTAGGEPASLSLIRAGDMVRLHGVYDPATGRNYADTILGETRCTKGAQTMPLAPVGLVSGTLAAVTEEILTRAAQRKFRA